MILSIIFLTSKRKIAKPNYFENEYDDNIKLPPICHLPKFGKLFKCRHGEQIGEEEQMNLCLHFNLLRKFLSQFVCCSDFSQKFSFLQFLPRKKIARYKAIKTRYLIFGLLPRIPNPISNHWTPPFVLCT